MRFKRNNPQIHISQVLHKDFFEFQQNDFFDVIIEQTFFCAINPRLREKYITKAQTLLTDEGKIIGLLFNKKLDTEPPPVGGTIEEYEILFSKKFIIQKLEKVNNSITHRKGHELWIEFMKK